MSSSFQTKSHADIEHLEIIELSERTRPQSVQGHSTDVPADDSTIIPENVLSLSNPKANKFRYWVCLLWCFCLGFGDAAPGAILPYIENYYHIGYSIVSLIWIGVAVGFILVAILADKIQHYLGQHKSLIFGSSCSIISLALVSSGTKFPVIVVAFVFYGIGGATNLSQANVFTAKLDKSSTYLGILHGSYGIGATIAPIIATAMMDQGVKWHLFYLIPLGLQICCVTGFAITFVGADDDLKPWDQQIEESSEEENRYLLKAALTNKATWIIAFFCLFYQGSEVSLAGWIVTFLLDYRDGNISSVGYVASGFWAGLTLGRFLLTTLIYKYFNARRGILFLTSFSIVTIVLSWTIPNVIASGTMISVCGIFIGPIYSILIGYAAKILPKKIQVVSLTIMTAFGSSGGALFPFITGLISEFAGTFVVLPISIGLLAAMTGSWLLLPNVERTGLIKHWWHYII